MLDSLLFLDILYEGIYTLFALQLQQLIVQEWIIDGFDGLEDEWIGVGYIWLGLFYAGVGIGDDVIAYCSHFNSN